jgi:hypothetical protein
MARISAIAAAEQDRGRFNVQCQRTGYDHPILPGNLERRLPDAYVGDCFYLEGGQLKVIHAPYDSFEQYKQTFFNPTPWPAPVDFFAKNDPLYDSFIFGASLLDRSSLVRFARRAYNQNRSRSILHAVLDMLGSGASVHEDAVPLEPVGNDVMRCD